MPSGEIHYKYFMAGYFVELPLTALLLLWDWKFALGNIAGYSFHRYADNDLDIMGVNSAEGRQVNELPGIGYIMFGISSVYGSIFRRKHRSFWTHFPGISTLIRLIFFFGIPFFLLDRYGINLIGNGWHMFYIGFWSGLSQADTIHYVLDITKGGG
jgi:hypothetical protein